MTNGLKANNVLAPKCFNLRSICNRNTTSFFEGIKLLEMRGKFCTPSVDICENICLGESSFCTPIGTVKMTDEELLNNVRSLKCNKCGMEDNLPPLYRTIINN